MNKDAPILQALVVEDDPDAATIYASALQSVGFETEVARTGAQALEQLKRSAPALLVLDMHLPQVAGATILDYIQANERLGDVLVIIVTGDRALADDRAFQRRQVVQILVKPVTYSRLRDLAQLLKLSNWGAHHE
ncbi:MAG TPA: response regulator [Chloroflexi bacterium]|nr:response regulator [Chloroflexota bacterium]